MIILTLQVEYGDTARLMQVVMPNIEVNALVSLPNMKLPQWLSFHSNVIHASVS